MGVGARKYTGRGRRLPGSAKVEKENFFIMKIGFDISQTGTQKAGCGYFAESLIRHLSEIDAENQYILYPTFGDLFWDPDWSSGTCRIARSNFQCHRGQKTFREARFFWNHPPADFEEQLGNPQIIHSNNFFCPSRLQNARLVYTLYDLSFLVHPEWTTEENRTGCFEGVFHASLYADFIISISHYSRNHFLEVFPHYPPDRILVAHPASRFAGQGEVSQPESLKLLKRNQFWLTVGVLEPRKNHLGLLRAYALLKANRGTTFPLVIAGAKGWLMDHFEKEMDTLNLRRDIILLGYVDDTALQWLYQNCFAFIYPSFFEGFGLPVTEAMSLGAPVIASKVSSLPEIVGEAGILIDPLDENQLYQSMQKLSACPQFHLDLKDKVSRQATQFSWKSTALVVLQCYREVLLRERIFSRSLFPES